MKILYLCQRIPFPPDRGDRIPVYHQIQRLRKTHEVVVGSLAHTGTRKNAEMLEEESGVKVLAPDHPRWRQLSGTLLAFLRGRPLSLGYFRNSALQSLVDVELTESRFDAVIVFSSSMAQYVENRRGVPQIMHFCDVDSLKWESLARTSYWPMRWIYRRESRTLLAYERKIAATFDASCVVSRNEAELFRQYIPGIIVDILENGVDANYFSTLSRKIDGINIVFVGVMDYPPNAEAVVFFSRHVWSAIREVYPDARFTIVGARPAKSVLGLASIPGIEVTGYVPDVRPYLAVATVSIAPLGTARGVQNKILEAMAAGVPVLTTPDVAKGLPDGAEALVFTAERSVEAFAHTLLDLIENDAVREKRAVDAVEFIRRNCGWDIKLRALDTLLGRIVKSGC
ncbi:MAG: TIGR03087 family PEP-CTERM/XrtA system glycosyltransferase [Clostridiales bacterium]|nr:TIGR03087 family PEP-CTERM/XrtA system glycosyltransferase [Clostridiales bacterium]